MVYLLTQNDDGKYIKDGTRYDVLEAGWVRGPRAKDFVEFESLEEAAAFYGLTPVKEEEE